MGWDLSAWAGPRPAGRPPTSTSGRPERRPTTTPGIRPAPPPGAGRVGPAGGHRVGGATAERRWRERGHRPRDRTFRGRPGADRLPGPRRSPGGSSGLREPARHPRGSPGPGRRGGRRVRRRRPDRTEPSGTAGHAPGDRAARYPPMPSDICRCTPGAPGGPSDDRWRHPPHHCWSRALDGGLATVGRPAPRGGVLGPDLARALTVPQHRAEAALRHGPPWTGGRPGSARRP